MTTELTFRKGIELREALREAFPSSTALTQVVFDQFEIHLYDLSQDDSYREAINKLILWVEGKNKTGELIMGARRLNPGNLKLRDFEDEYKKHNSQQHFRRILTQDLSKFWMLIDALLMLSISNTSPGRRKLLTGIPGNLNNDETNAKSDLHGIIDQLDGLGPLASGQWPLLVLIDNALHYAEGYKEPVDKLKMVQQFLKEKYGVE